MTPRQRECLDFVTGYIDQHRASPSYADIMAGLNLASKSGAHRLVHALVREGYLEFSGYHARSLRVLVSSEWERDLVKAAKAYACNPQSRQAQQQLHSVAMEATS